MIPVLRHARAWLCRRSVWMYFLVVSGVCLLLLDLLHTRPISKNQRKTAGGPSSDRDDSEFVLRFWRGGGWLLDRVRQGLGSMTLSSPQGVAYKVEPGPGTDSRDYTHINDTWQSVSEEGVAQTRTAEGQEQEEKQEEDDDQSSLRFLVLGDWGGSSGPPYTTYIQHAVARAMEIIAQANHIHAVISTGDNFYENGVHNLQDPHFKATFEDVYSHPVLQKPWFTLAGNHDYFGNVSAQIAYTNLSKRWYFPWYSYVVTWQLNSKRGTAQVTFIMVDTIILCGNCGMGEDPLAPPAGPVDPALAEETWRWFEDTLQATQSSDHLVVVGHLPIESGGLHGPTECLRERMTPLLLKYRVGAYLTGHDHNLQHIFTSLPNYTWIVDNYIVGAGAKVESRRTHQGTIPPHQLLFYHDETSPERAAGGFGLLEMDSRWMNMTFYNSKAQPLHRHATESRHFSKL